MKPIREWLLLIKDDTIREKALKNYNKNYPNDTKHTAVDFPLALQSSFIFDNTPEGSDYWHNLIRNLPELLSSPKEEFKVGDYVILEKAGGWGFHPDDNGCLGKVTFTSVRKFSKTERCQSVSGDIINPKMKSDDRGSNKGKFEHIPILNLSHNPTTVVVRKATQAEIDAVVKPKGYSVGTKVTYTGEDVRPTFIHGNVYTVGEGSCDNFIYPEEYKSQGYNFLKAHCRLATAGEVLGSTKPKEVTDSKFQVGKQYHFPNGLVEYNKDDVLKIKAIYLVGDVKTFSFHSKSGRQEFSEGTEFYRLLQSYISSEEVIDTKGWKVGDIITPDQLKNAKSQHSESSPWFDDGHWADRRKIILFDSKYGKPSVQVSGTTDDYRILLESLPNKTTTMKFKMYDRVKTSIGDGIIVVERKDPYKGFVICERLDSRGNTKGLYDELKGINYESSLDKQSFWSFCIEELTFISHGTAPVKTPPIEEKEEYKVGNWVTVIPDTAEGQYKNCTNHSGIKIGQTKKITNVSTLCTLTGLTNHRWYCITDNFSSEILDCNFRKATQDEINKALGVLPVDVKPTLKEEVMDSRIVTRDNAYVGMKVVRGRDWKWDNQDKDSIYGVVTALTKDGEFEVVIDWMKNKTDTTALGKGYYYRVGMGNKYDLYIYEEKPVVKDLEYYKQFIGRKVKLSDGIIDIVKDIGSAKVESKYHYWFKTKAGRQPNVHDSEHPSGPYQCELLPVDYKEETIKPKDVYISDIKEVTKDDSWIKEGAWVTFKEGQKYSSIPYHNTTYIPKVDGRKVFSKYSDGETGFDYIEIYLKRFRPATPAEIDQYKHFYPEYERKFGRYPTSITVKAYDEPSVVKSKPKIVYVPVDEEKDSPITVSRIKKKSITIPFETEEENTKILFIKN